MDQEAKYWRDKWLESERLVQAMRNLLENGFSDLNSEELSKVLARKMREGEKVRKKK